MREGGKGVSEGSEGGKEGREGREGSVRLRGRGVREGRGYSN